MMKPYRSLQPQAISSLFGDESAVKTSLPLTCIETTQQPRRYFDPDKMKELIDSVAKYGIIEPILVRSLSDSSYELIAGERRYRAALEVGLAQIPVVICSFTDSEVQEIALLENLQREDLNPLEETEAILSVLAIRLDKSTSDVVKLLYQLNTEYNKLVYHNVMVKKIVDEEAATLVKDFFQGLGLNWQSFVKNRLPVLKMPSEIKDAIMSGKIAFSSAKLIASIKDEAFRKAFLDEAILKKYSLMVIKERLKAENEEKKAVKTKPELSVQMTNFYNRFQASQVWNDPNKEQRVRELLAELDKLLP